MRKYNYSFFIQEQMEFCFVKHFGLSFDYGQYSSCSWYLNFIYSYFKTGEFAKYTLSVFHLLVKSSIRISQNTINIKRKIFKYNFKISQVLIFSVLRMNQVQGISIVPCKHFMLESFELFSVLRVLLLPPSRPSPLNLQTPVAGEHWRQHKEFVACYEHFVDLKRKINDSD